MAKEKNIKILAVIRSVLTLISAGIIIYILISPLTILFKVAMVNFFVFITVQLYIKEKAQRMKPLNIVWYIITILLFASLIFAET